MSERTFFSLRYALPGYTFLLMLILVSYPSLIKAEIIVQDSTLVATFLVFFSLLGGSALGFLTSQVWYAYHIKFRMTKYGVLPEMIRFLRKTYDLTEEKDYYVVFADYVHRLSDDKTLIYTQRRFDLMHIFGSTLVALIIGSVVGLLVRFESFSMNVTLENAIKSISSISLNSHEITTYDAGVILTFAFLFILLLFGLRHVSKEHSMAFDFSVRKVVNTGKFPPYRAKFVFNEHYFRKNIVQAVESRTD